MRTLLLILLLSVPCMASGPKYSFSDSKLNDELDNVYHDIDSSLKGGVFISSLTVSSLTVTSLTSGTTFGKLRAYASMSTTTGASTTGTTLVDSPLTIAITPTSATSKIFVLATVHTLIGADAGTIINGRLTIDRSGTTIYDGVRDVGYNGIPVFGSITDTLSFSCLDAPATTSALTYKVRFARSAGTGTGTMYINDGSAQSTLSVFELAP